MAFIRTKTIKGIEYNFLVKGVREGAKVSQKVVAYLGPYKTVRGAYEFWSREAKKKDPVIKRQAAKKLKALKPYMKENR